MIVGTAGHVDHGKSALVLALTGTNPDRWLEEQVRGMTLDLGFARLNLGDGLEAGIVDVPGHERFLHNMLAGASGMDLLLLVVALDEGVKPQTLEHLEILRYLNVRATVVVLTKADLLAAPERDAAQAAIAASLRATIAGGAKVQRVSSVTGEGVEELRAEIARQLRALPERDARAPVYLPVDRAFTLAGVGTVVTGTLVQGTIETGATLQLQPSGASVRIRSAQVFGEARTRVEAGSRVALNLAGIELAAVERGAVVAEHELQARGSAVVRFTPLPGALALLRRRTPVRVHAGAAEILGTLVFDAPPEDAGEVRAELHLRAPTVLFAGVRFVVRRPSPKTLLGGGYVEGFQTTHAADGLSELDEIVLAVLQGRAGEPADAAAVAYIANVREELAAAALDALVERDAAVRLQRPLAYLHADAARATIERTLEHLRELHQSQPWAVGATSIALARALAVSEPLLVRVLAAYAEQGRLAIHAGYYALTEHEPRFTPEQRAFFDELVPADASSPLLPAPYADVIARVRAARVEGVDRAFDTLVLRGALVKVGDAAYRGTQIAQIVARIETFLHEHEHMTAAEFRDVLGTSRKYAVPLLEWLDARGVTLRSGDHRILRKKRQ